MKQSQSRFTRRTTLLGIVGSTAAIASTGFWPSLLNAREFPLGFMTAGQGSAFLPYGNGLQAWLSNTDTPIEVLESGGSNDNLRAVNENPRMLGMAFLGSAAAAITGTGAFGGAPTENIRALFAIYNTSFQIATLRTSGITDVASLDGRSVGVGPESGPAENFFRALSRVADITPVVVNGTPAELSDKLIAGEIDALWQGAIAPIPALVAVQARADAIIFGLNEHEVASMRLDLPHLASETIPAGTYGGQDDDILTVAGWNVVIAHKDLPDQIAYDLTQNVLRASDPSVQIHPFAAATRVDNAVRNAVVPFHPGALRALRDLGASL